MNNQLKLLIEDAKFAVVEQQNAHQDLQAKTSLEVERLIQTAFYKGMDAGRADKGHWYKFDQLEEIFNENK